MVDIPNIYPQHHIVSSSVSQSLSCKLSSHSKYNFLLSLWPLIVKLAAFIKVLFFLHTHVLDLLYPSGMDSIILRHVEIYWMSAFPLWLSPEFYFFHNCIMYLWKLSSCSRKSAGTLVREMSQCISQSHQPVLTLSILWCTQKIWQLLLILIVQLNHVKGNLLSTQ